MTDRVTQEIAIDPGVRVVGWAKRYGSAIVSCGIARSDIPRIETRALDIAARICPYYNAAPVPVAVESMRWRPNDPKSQPNDLIDVQTVGLLVAARLSGGLGIRLVPPQEWKRSLPKAVVHNRIAGVLSEDEREIVANALARAPKEHAKEILDAVGISLYASGRVDGAGRKNER